ncbi:hypothetical protein BJ965_000142 [Streptomyces luteogriseus]|uniref:Uncharacterized protein n=1 Tax=Streptomyces luteogriseus TaxID=68233 RepID=A0A7W7DGR4_9ACTN|nr:hypothetical protein [Streptomyces luteogriseus]MBB4710260.1 hypothetical protein [Streptomyces luteogriseus]
MRNTGTPRRRNLLVLVLVVLLLVVVMPVPGGKRNGAGLPATRRPSTAAPKGRDAP